MKVQILKTAAVAFALLLGVATSPAQSPQVVASIPFDFQVGSQHMHAGRYAVVNDNSLMTIRNLEKSDAASVLTNSIGSLHPEQESRRLIFLRIGSEYYLTQVWSPDFQDGRKIQLPKDRQMKAKNGDFNQQTVLAMARH